MDILNGGFDMPPVITAFLESAIVPGKDFDGLCSAVRDLLLDGGATQSLVISGPMASGKSVLSSFFRSVLELSAPGIKPDIPIKEVLSAEVSAPSDVSSLVIHFDKTMLEGKGADPYLLDKLKDEGPAFVKWVTA